MDWHDSGSGRGEERIESILLHFIYHGLVHGSILDVEDHSMRRKKLKFIDQTELNEAMITEEWRRSLTGDGQVV